MVFFVLWKIALFFSRSVLVLLKPAYARLKWVSINATNYCSMLEIQIHKWWRYAPNDPVQVLDRLYEHWLMDNFVSFVSFCFVIYDMNLFGFQVDFSPLASWSYFLYGQGSWIQLFRWLWQVVIVLLDSQSIT